MKCRPTVTGVDGPTRRANRSARTAESWEVEQKAFDLQGADGNQDIFPIIRALRSLLIRLGVPLAGAE